MKRIVIAFALLLPSFSVRAELITATPATVVASIAAAKSGDTIELQPGDYATIKVHKRKFDRTVRILAGDARVKGVSIWDSAGVEWIGGDIVTPKPQGFAADGYAMHIIRSQKVAVRNAQIRDALRGIVIGAVDDVELTGNTILDGTVDGINIGTNSHRVLIDRNYLATRSTGEAHPDFIQSWSRMGAPVSDITVTNNIALGRGQAVYFGNVPTRVTKGVKTPDPGFDRITITGNYAAVSLPNGIVTADCRDCVITGNHIDTLPGSRFRSKVVQVRGVRENTCGNIVTALPDSDATRACKAQAGK